jgi:hypothetical protein
MRRTSGVTYAIDQIKDEPHGDAELFKVELAIVIHICEIPDSLKLLVLELAVLKDGRCSCAVKMCGAVC